MNRTPSAFVRAFRYLLQLVHLLGVGLWLGSLIFFPFCVALPVIDGMRALANRPDNWLHLQSDQEGIRLAGEFLDIVFGRYFLFQLGCGLAAFLPALLWLRRPGAVHKIRGGLVLLGIILVAANEWWLADRVRDLRQLHYSAHPAPQAVTGQPTSANDSIAPRPPATVEKEFWFWHTASLATDLACLVVVFIVMLLAPVIPTSDKPATEPIHFDA